MPITADQPATEPRFIKSAELKSRWSVSDVTLYRMRKKGLLTAHRLGGAVRYALSEVTKLEAQAAA